MTQTDKHDPREAVLYSIVASHACLDAGLSKQALEGGVVADLLAACERLLATGGISANGNVYLPSPQTVTEAKAAIARAKAP